MLILRKKSFSKKNFCIYIKNLVYICTSYSPQQQTLEPGRKKKKQGANTHTHTYTFPPASSARGAQQYNGACAASDNARKRTTAKSRRWRNKSRAYTRRPTLSFVPYTQRRLAPGSDIFLHLLCRRLSLSLSTRARCLHSK